MLDLRWPMGLMFLVVGALITTYGLVTEFFDQVHYDAIYSRCQGININLWWGLVLLAFSAFMLIMAYRARKRDGKQ
jgi:hypothetical protein